MTKCIILWLWKKKKKLFRSGGFLRSVGRGQSNNFFFLALNTNKSHIPSTCSSYAGWHRSAITRPWVLKVIYQPAQKCDTVVYFCLQNNRKMIPLEFLAKLYENLADTKFRLATTLPTSYTCIDRMNTDITAGQSKLSDQKIAQQYVCAPAGRMV